MTVQVRRRQDEGDEHAAASWRTSQQDKQNGGASPVRFPLRGKLSKAWHCGVRGCSAGRVIGFGGAPEPCCPFLAPGPPPDSSCPAGRCRPGLQAAHPGCCQLAFLRKNGGRGSFKAVMLRPRLATWFLLPSRSLPPSPAEENTLVMSKTALL